MAIAKDFISWMNGDFQPGYCFLSHLLPCFLYLLGGLVVLELPDVQILEEIYINGTTINH